MRRTFSIIGALGAVALGACTPIREVGPPPAPPRESPELAVRQPAAPVVMPPPAARVEPASAVRLRAPRFGRGQVAGIAIDFVAFDRRSHQLVVADQAGGPASRWPDAAAAGRATGALAALNAGFFTVEGEPLGLVVTGGERRGALNRSSSLGSGVYVAGEPAGPQLLRRESLGARSDAPELLQAGPFLVENSAPVSGLSAAIAARSLIASDGGDQWLIARTAPCSLAALGKALANSRFAGFPVRTALNLDGGSSSDLWVSSAVTGGPTHVRPFWNKPVRNFLLLRPR